MRRALRTFLSGVAGGIAWIAGMSVFFGPAQAILADPELQSAKFLAAFTDPDQPPRMAESGAVVVVGLMLIAQVYALVFAVIEQGLPGRSATGRGLAFGAVAWALAFTWFEFYLPWNVMREPAALVALELACWLGVMLTVGLAIAWTCRLVDRLGTAKA